MASVLLAACVRNQEAPPKTSESDAKPSVASTIQGQELVLTGHDGVCRISSAAGPMDLGIPWPCNFHRRPDGSVRTLQRGQAVIALVEASQPHPELAGSCKTEIRGLAIAGGKVYVSEHKDTVAQCPPFQWDEQMFKGLFADREPGARAGGRSSR